MKHIEPDEGCFLNQVNTFKFRVLKCLFDNKTHKFYQISSFAIPTMEPEDIEWQRQIILSENNFSNHKNPVSSCTTHKLLSVLLHFTENPFEDHKPGLALNVFIFPFWLFYFDDKPLMCRYAAEAENINLRNGNVYSMPDCLCRHFEGGDVQSVKKKDVQWPKWIWNITALLCDDGIALKCWTRSNQSPFTVPVKHLWF